MTREQERRIPTMSIGTMYAAINNAFCDFNCGLKTVTIAE